MLLDKKVILVTGGSRGIGAAIVRVLARHGATVAINYNTSREKADALAESIVKDGGRARAWSADVLDAGEVKRMIAEIEGELGRIDGVVNDAIAGTQAGLLEDVTGRTMRTPTTMARKPC